MADRPNILLITLDQFRADCLGVAGHPLVQTPNLDRLAADGVRFTHHFSNCAPCAPGYVCAGGTSSRAPASLALDGGYACPPGHYCPPGSSAPAQSTKGTRSS